MEGVHRIAVERRQRILRYGWRFDRQKETGELTRAAIAYASKALGLIGEIPDLWPWAAESDKRPTNATRSEQIAELTTAIHTLTFLMVDNARRED